MPTSSSSDPPRQRTGARSTSPPCRVTLTIDGRVATTGTGADALGDPRAALAWIANNHAAQGAALRAGDIVTTGVCGKPSAIAAGSRVVADLGPVGVAEATLA